MIKRFKLLPKWYIITNFITLVLIITSVVLLIIGTKESKQINDLKVNYQEGLVLINNHFEEDVTILKNVYNEEFIYYHINGQHKKFSENRNFIAYYTYTGNNRGVYDIYAEDSFLGVNLLERFDSVEYQPISKYVTEDLVIPILIFVNILMFITFSLLIINNLIYLIIRRKTFKANNQIN